MFGIAGGACLIAFVWSLFHYIRFARIDGRYCQNELRLIWQFGRHRSSFQEADL